MHTCYVTAQWILTNAHPEKKQARGGGGAKRVRKSARHAEKVGAHVQELRWWAELSRDPEKTRRQMAGSFLTRWNVWNAIKWATPTEVKLVPPCSQDKFRSIGLQKAGPRYAAVVCVCFYQGNLKNSNYTVTHLSHSFLAILTVSQVLSFRTSQQGPEIKSHPAQRTGCSQWTL